MATLLELAGEAERATVDMEGAILERAWETLAEVSSVFRRFACAPVPGFNNNAAKFGMAMDARAHESAAMTLVPEGFSFELTTTGYKPGATVCGNIMGDVHEGAYASTTALALCAAALRAHASQLSKGAA